MEVNYTQIANLKSYFLEKANTSAIHQDVTKIDRIIALLKLGQTNIDPSSNIPTINEVKYHWQSKALHGKYIAAIAENAIDSEASLA